MPATQVTACQSQSHPQVVLSTMSKLLFRMRHVPEDEALEVRELLEKHEIEYFETFAGNWGISLPAIWLRNIEQFDFARQLLDEYQQERSLRLRREYQLGKERGEVKTSWHSFRESPLQFIVCSLMIVLVLYVSTQFFLSF